MGIYTTENIERSIKRRYSYEQGFTLIEVLVAAVILFAAITTVSLIYRGAFTSSEKAESHVAISGSIPAIMAQIKVDIRKAAMQSVTESQYEGQSWNVNYHWKATVKEERDAIDRLDADSGEYEKSHYRFQLWEVSLEVTHKSTVEHYTFEQLAWSPNEK
ncbi:PulJ/GspJ family protein [Thalassotalea fusca]